MILLEGSEQQIVDCAMSRDAIQGALISVSVILGIPMLRSGNAEESARIMLYAGRQLRRAISGVMPRPGHRPKSRRRIQLHVLQGLPSVGPTRAARLLDSFGSVEAALTAGVEDLARVPGVGRSTAQKIRWAVS